MKIVYLSNSTIPSRTANSIQVMKMCQAFAENGHEVTLLSQNRKQDYETNVKDVYQYYGVKPDFDIQRVTNINIRKVGTVIYSWLAARTAYQHKPELVYGRSITGCFFSAHLGIPVAFEAHTPIEGNPIREWIFRQLIGNHNLKKIVVITHALKEHYQRCYTDIQCPIQVLPDGANVIENQQIKPIVLPNQEKRFQVGYVGHLYKGKGMEVIVQLAKLSPWADFHIVGGLEADIQFWQKQCNDLSNIIFWGYVPHQETVRYNLAFDVVLLPNQEFVGTVDKKSKTNISQWTSPLKAFEYMAAGKPIICSDLPVLREIFEHHVNAILCPPTNLKAWQTALEYLRNDETSRKRLGETAKKIFLEKFSWQARAKNILEDIDP